jgi:hypothetical protein
MSYTQLNSSGLTMYQSGTQQTVNIQNEGNMEMTGDFSANQIQTKTISNGSSINNAVSSQTVTATNQVTTKNVIYNTTNNPLYYDVSGNHNFINNDPYTKDFPIFLIPVSGLYMIDIIFYQSAGQYNQGAIAFSYSSVFTDTFQAPVYNSVQYNNTTSALNINWPSGNYSNIYPNNGSPKSFTLYYNLTSGNTFYLQIYCSLTSGESHQIWFNTIVTYVGNNTPI